MSSPVPATAQRSRRRLLARRRGRLGRAAAYGSVVALAVGAIGIAARLKVPALLDADSATIRWATDLVRPHHGLRSFLHHWQTWTMPAWPYAGVAVICIVMLVRRPRAWSRPVWAVLTCLLGWCLANLVKEVARRARPVVPDPIEIAPGYSFPSGHAMNSAIVATVLVILLWPRLGPAWRRVLVAAAVAYAALTGAHRILLGVHYPSDVIAGWILGAGFVLASYAGYVDWRPAPLASEGDSDGDGPERNPRRGS